LESIQKRLDKKNKKNNDENQNRILERAQNLINDNNDINKLYDEFDKKDVRLSGLLSIKPKLYVCNVDENSIDKGNDYTKSFIEKYGSKNTLTISAEIENQLNELENEERKNYMKMINVDDTGLNLLIKKGYDLLSLETFFTSGIEETRAWTINKNCMAPQAAGIIHTDFEKGFIRAETVSYQDFVGSGGWLKSRENGKMRLEGKDYIVKDGDVLNFRFNT
jgi:Predicted GTPase, probable translation factor